MFGRVQAARYSSTLQFMNWPKDCVNIHQTPFPRKSLGTVDTTKDLTAGSGTRLRFFDIITRTHRAHSYPAHCSCMWALNFFGVVIISK